LTTSKADQDRYECFNACAAGYFVKPVDYQGFLDAMRVLDMYWTLSEIPGSDIDSPDAILKKSPAN